jgi:copper chaperone CopZ
MDFRFVLPLAAAACFIAGGCATSPEATVEGSENAKSATQMAVQSGEAAGMTTAVFKVDGMTCGGCRGEVKEVLSSTDGVKDCKVEESGVVTVTFDDSKVEKKDLVAKVNTKTSFKATL